MDHRDQVETFLRRAGSSPWLAGGFCRAYLAPTSSVSRNPQQRHPRMGRALEYPRHLKQEKDKVPRDMFILGMRRQVVDDAAVRQEEAVEDVEEFGINWDGIEDEQLVRELQGQAENPFDGYAPDALNEVPCEPPDCPLTLDQVNGLDATLSAQFNMTAFHDMDVYTTVWIQALTWCRDLF